MLELSETVDSCLLNFVDQIGRDENGRKGISGAASGEGSVKSVVGSLESQSSGGFSRGVFDSRSVVAAAHLGSMADSVIFPEDLRWGTLLLALPLVEVFNAELSDDVTLAENFWSLTHLFQSCFWEALPSPPPVKGVVVSVDRQQGDYTAGEDSVVVPTSATDGGPSLAGAPLLAGDFQFWGETRVVGTLRQFLFDVADALLEDAPDFASLLLGLVEEGGGDQNGDGFGGGPAEPGSPLSPGSKAVTSFWDNLAQDASKEHQKHTLQMVVRRMQAVREVEKERDRQRRRLSLDRLVLFDGFTVGDLQMPSTDASGTASTQRTNEMEKQADRDAGVMGRKPGGGEENGQTGGETEEVEGERNDAVPPKDVRQTVRRVFVLNDSLSAEEPQLALPISVNDRNDRESRRRETLALDVLPPLIVPSLRRGFVGVLSGDALLLLYDILVLSAAPLAAKTGAIACAAFLLAMRPSLQRFSGGNQEGETFPVVAAARSLLLAAPRLSVLSLAKAVRAFRVRMLTSLGVPPEIAREGPGVVGAEFGTVVPEFHWGYAPLNNYGPYLDHLHAERALPEDPWDRPSRETVEKREKEAAEREREREEKEKEEKKKEEMKKAEEEAATSFFRAETGRRSLSPEKMRDKLSFPSSPSPSRRKKEGTQELRSFLGGDTHLTKSITRKENEAKGQPSLTDEQSPTNKEKQKPTMPDYFGALETNEKPKTPDKTSTAEKEGPEPHRDNPTQGDGDSNPLLSLFTNAKDK
uniref:Uncharacterized protein n=1 Tax=Chromera velia CCMP2878 TaxID=1169474 RepID=A0A0G4H5R3_9ALVE|eukprot:Cvel_24794.t1-p1 / transcript=Cvel_24794.t1 / gene=Cvel_24794 / organism=Chromera_velia_CCMP2878 / gene_product=hypothetical protein / transcript_product=hypothetical protein / location=Cvel_scaffold2730:3756-10699(+) / protein_length=752 / sequence_SO=supercontig / SO=protein_coding / is_pseudo=false